MTERHETFIRLAENRMSRIFQTANTLANLSVTTRYHYSKAEVDELFTAYEAGGAEVSALFGEERYTPYEAPLTFAFSTAGEPNNPKNQQFRRLASQRMETIYYNLGLISNLRNRKNYQYSLEELDDLFSAYMEKGLEIRRFFEPHLEPLSSEFKFR